MASALIRWQQRRNVFAFALKDGSYVIGTIIFFGAVQYCQGRKVSFLRMYGKVRKVLPSIVCIGPGTGPMSLSLPNLSSGQIPR